MNTTDYLFGMNYVDQLQRDLRTSSRRYLNITSLIRGASEPIQYAFIWDETTEGFSVWNKRNRIFDIFFGHSFINLDLSPRTAIGLHDETLLAGMTVIGDDSILTYESL